MNARRRRGTRRSALRRIVLAPGGWFLLGAGVLVFMTPLPFGLAMMAVALMILLRHSPRGRWAAARLARRFPVTAARIRGWQARFRRWRTQAARALGLAGEKP
jgi:hypothetical protein